MGRRGPAPTPSALRALRGNAGKRSMPKNEPQPPALDSLAAPSFLGGYALEEWNRVAPDLKKLGLLTVVDVPALAGYCGAYERWRQAKEAVDATIKEAGKDKSTGLMMAIAKGLVKMEKLALAQLKAMAAEFGFTPASRSRVSALPQDKEKDAFEEWAKGKVMRGGKA